MTREEAIERIKYRIGKQAWALDENDTEALYEVIPELRESEDERIRQVFVDFIENYLFWERDGLSKEKALAWFEKHKGPEFASASTMIPSCWEEKREEQKLEEHKAFEEWIEDYWSRNKVNNMDDEIQFDHKGFVSFCEAYCYPQNLALHDTFGYEEGRQTGQNEGVKLVLNSPEKYGLQKEQKCNERDFTIYHPLKNGKGEYECIPYSFYGSLTSFSEDKDLIDFLRTCFYTKEKCNEWIEQQKEQKPLKVEENAYFDPNTDMWFIKKEQKPTATINGEPIPTENQSVNIPLVEWSEEDEKRIKQLIYDTEFIKAHYEKKKEQLGERFNDALIKDCDEQIAWLNSLKNRGNFPKSNTNSPCWKPSEEQIEAFENCLESIPNKYFDDMCELYADLKKKMEE